MIVYREERTAREEVEIYGHQKSQGSTEMKGDIAQKRVGYLRRVDYLYMALSILSSSGWLMHLTSTGSNSSL